MIRYFALVFLVGCSSFQMRDGIYVQDSTFQPHVDEYLESKLYYLGTKEVSYAIRVEFGSVQKNQAAVCRTETVRNEITNDEHVRKKIIVNKTYWNTVSDVCKELIIFHELGHCDLDLDHGDKIMQQKANCYGYEANHEDWIMSLFDTK